MTPSCGRSLEPAIFDAVHEFEEPAARTIGFRIRESLITSSAIFARK
jgi:hypothetical protein